MIPLTRNAAQGKFISMKVPPSSAKREATNKAFVVEVPELPGCMADRATYKEAVAKAQMVIAEWLETSQPLHDPIPEPKGKLAYA